MKKHNQWMQILQAVFAALAGLMRSLRLSDSPAKSDSPQETDDTSGNL